jgi:hypothetical protein
LVSDGLIFIAHKLGSYPPTHRQDDWTATLSPDFIASIPARLEPFFLGRWHWNVRVNRLLVELLPLNGHLIWWHVRAHHRPSVMAAQYGRVLAQRLPFWKLGAAGCSHNGGGSVARL